MKIEQKAIENSVKKRIKMHNLFWSKMTMVSKMLQTVCFLFETILRSRGCVKYEFWLEELQQVNERNCANPVL